MGPRRILGVRNVAITAVTGREIRVINQTSCCKRVELLRRRERASSEV